MPDLACRLVAAVVGLRERALLDLAVHHRSRLAPKRKRGVRVLDTLPQQSARPRLMVADEVEETPRVPSGQQLRHRGSPGTESGDRYRPGGSGAGLSDQSVAEGSSPNSCSYRLAKRPRWVKPRSMAISLTVSCPSPASMSRSLARFSSR